MCSSDLCPTFGDQANGNVIGIVTCNPGEHATGGGYNVVGESTAVEASGPLPTQGTPTKWFVSGNSNQTTGNLGTAYAVCVSP